jgi:hypothetical protein
MNAKSIHDQRDLKMANEASAFSRWTARREFREDPARFLELNQAEKARMVLRYANYNKRENILVNLPTSDVLLEAYIFLRAQINGNGHVVSNVEDIVVMPGDDDLLRTRPAFF